MGETQSGWSFGYRESCAVNRSREESPEAGTERTLEVLAGDSATQGGQLMGE